MKETCSAHDMLYDTVVYLRDNQDKTFGIVNSMATRQEKQDVYIQEIQSTQKQIITMIGKRKWTVNKVITLASALFGSGGVGYAIVSVVLRGH